MKKSVFNNSDVIKDYKSGLGVEALASKYHTAKIRIKGILKEANVSMKTVGAQRKLGPMLVSDWRIPKFQDIDGFHYEAHSKDGEYKTLDYMNAGGMLTSYIKNTFGISSTLYERRVYYMRTGNYWWEQWFDIISVKNKETKKCPYCNWETKDLVNNSGAFLSHLSKSHGISRIEHLKKHPEDRKYLTLANKTLDKEMETDTNKFVTCAVCGRKLSRIDSRHLAKHGLTKLDYLLKFGSQTYSKEYYENLLKLAKRMNISLDGKNLFTSKPEKEILEFVRHLGFSASKNRKILNGRELDIFIPSKSIAIEFNGCAFHTEFFGKKNWEYHLEKLLLANSKNIKLIQVFEDEYYYHKELVFNKIKHALGVDVNLPSIYGRVCDIKEISLPLAGAFMEKFHIQGPVSSSIYLGAFYNDNLIGVMQFKKENREGFWELTRFATDYNYRCPGVGGKLFSYFIKKYSPLQIKSFADRRWTTSSDNNLYTKLGFILDSIIPPSYSYYNPSIDRYKRLHRFSLRKKALAKKISSDMGDLTELEMTKALGYDRIWDCGLFKYVWKNI